MGDSVSGGGFRARSGVAVCGFALACLVSPASAELRQAPVGRFDPLYVPRAGGVIRVEARPLSELPADDADRRAWDRLAAAEGGHWKVWLDTRSGAPTLALIGGKRWADGGAAPEGPAPGADGLAELARRFLGDHRAALGAVAGQLVLDPVSSGPRGPHATQLRFAQIVDGVRVEGAHFDFHVARGNLVALGGHRLAPVRISARPDLDEVEARRVLDAFVRPREDDGIVELSPPELLLVPVDADPASPGAWSGKRGAGIRHVLVWRFRFTDRDGVASWTGEVDAHRGELFAFYDDTDYERIEGHVNPISDDGQCAIGGCPEPGFPMPFADYTEDGGPIQYANQHGLYECSSPGATIETTLAGQYFRIQDQCGAISETTVCANELDLGLADGVNCDVASGASAGNTDAARSAYYTLNTVGRKARFWMPGTPWLDSQVECRTNQGGACNASYSGGVIFMIAASGSCGNTAQLQGLVTHEWGHGLDDHDGGGDDNPGEAYADIVAVLEARRSCIGRGFDTAQTCSGYGDSCLSCVGLREMDWDARAAHTPATPTGFLANYCGSGVGPCGKEVHCESHLASETIFDLATRDLPALGLDPDSAWQLTERLWYQSRVDSGGDAYNCTIPVSDSCSASSWYHAFRLVDDDDGDLGNGTPHAGAIFAAFDRHDIACGSSTDAENQSTSSCPELAAPPVAFTAQTNEVAIDWDPVTNANGYRVYRNELGCDRAQFPIAETDAATTEYVDAGLANGFPVYYRVQALGANPVCEGPVSSCVEAAAQRTAGRVRFDAAAYGCSDVIGLEVTDANHPAATVTVELRSDTEATAESVVLTETAVGSGRFVGTIPTTASPPAADGLLSVAHGDLLTVGYVDLDDGAGGTDLLRQAYAVADCAPSTFTAVTVTGITETSATVEWSTSKPTTGLLEWGTSAALDHAVALDVAETDHAAVIGPLAACGRVYFRVTATDTLGYVAVADAEGAPFEFNAYTIQGILHEDSFESDSGWTLEGDWEIGVPQGLGTLPGDPVAASDGLQVLGQDLSGQGANPGDYEFNTTYAAISPVIDASATTGVELRFDRWLNYQNSGSVYIHVKDASGLWRQVWSSTTGLTESSWSERSLDISTYAAGNPTLQIRFLQDARFGRDAGWNVDRLLLRDSSIPLHGACGGCAGAPAFAGVVSVADDDPCADSGVTATWTVAPAWGTGNGGSYAVYRDVSPGFTPGPANVVAAGVVGTSWHDAAAPPDVELYYVVRAESDESCGSGPNNGGLTDGNLVHATVTNATGGGVPGPVGDTLVLSDAGAPDVSLTWAPVGGATSYDVERSSAPDAGFGLLAQPTGPGYADPGALTDGQTWYYRVTATGSCGGGSR